MTRVCSKCGISKPETIEHFNYRDGKLNAQCKECVREYKKQYYIANKEKVCSNVSEYRENNKEKVKESKSEYYNKNKEKILAKNKQWRIENKARKAEMDRLWGQNNKEHMQKRSKKYREENKEQIALTKREWYFRNKVNVTNYITEWHKENPERLNTYQQRRRAKRKMLPSTLTLAEWKKIQKDFNSGCAYCGEIVGLEQDHFVALTKGGEYTHNNIIPSCRSCNASKGNKDFFEWYPTYEHYSKQREKFILEYLGYIEDTQQLSIL